MHGPPMGRGPRGGLEMQPTKATQTSVTESRSERPSAQPRDGLVSRAWSPDLALTYVERCMLAVVALAADAGGRTWLPLRELALRAGLGDERSGRRVLARLEAAGWVERSTLARGAASPAGWALGTARALVALTGAFRALPRPLLGPTDAGRIMRACSPLSTLQRAVLAVVRGHLGATGAAWPSYQRIASMVGASERATGVAVRQLVERGALVATRVPPGHRLPSGERARDWRIVLVLGPHFEGLGSVTPGPRIRHTRAQDPKIDPSDRSVITEPPVVPAPAAPDPAAALARDVSRILQVQAAPAAVPTVRARLADGFSREQLLAAALAVTRDPWRWADAHRRAVGTVFGTPERAQTWVDAAIAAGFLAAPEDCVSVQDERTYAATQREQRIAEASGLADARERARGGALVRALVRRGSWT